MNIETKTKVLEALEEVVKVFNALQLGIYGAASCVRLRVSKVEKNKEAVLAVTYTECITTVVNEILARTELSYAQADVLREEDGYAFVTVEDGQVIKRKVYFVLSDCFTQSFRTHYVADLAIYKGVPLILDQICADGEHIGDLYKLAVGERGLRARESDRKLVFKHISDLLRYRASTLVIQPITGTQTYECTAKGEDHLSIFLNRRGITLYLDVHTSDLYIFSESAFPKGAFNTVSKVDAGLYYTNVKFFKPFDWQ